MRPVSGDQILNTSRCRFWLWSKDRADRSSIQFKAEAREQAAEGRAQESEQRAQESERRAQDENCRRVEDEERRRAHSLVAWLTTESDPGHVQTFGQISGRPMLHAHVLNTGSEVIREWALIVKHKDRAFTAKDMVMIGLIRGVVAPGQGHEVWLSGDDDPQSPLDAEVTLNFRDSTGQGWHSVGGVVSKYEMDGEAGLGAP